MTIQDRLSEIEERELAYEGFLNAANIDVLKLVSALKVSIDKFKEITNTTRLNDPNNYLAEHFKELSKQALTEIERILEGK